MSLSMLLVSLLGKRKRLSPQAFLARFLQKFQISYLGTFLQALATMNFNNTYRINFDESSVNFMDVYDVSFTNGMLNDAGDCVADTMMGMGGGPATAQITLGPPDQSGIGQMQYFEEFIDRFSTRPEMDYRADGINNETGCQALADSTGSNNWFYVSG